MAAAVQDAPQPAEPVMTRTPSRARGLLRRRQHFGALGARSADWRDHRRGHHEITAERLILPGPGDQRSHPHQSPHALMGAGRREPQGVGAQPVAGRGGVGGALSREPPGRRA